MDSFSLSAHLESHSKCPRSILDKEQNFPLLTHFVPVFPDMVVGPAWQWEFSWATNYEKECGRSGQRKRLCILFLDRRQTPKIRIITFLRAGQYYMYWNTPNLKSGLFGAFPILHVRSRNFVDILLLIWSSAGIWRWNSAKICKTRQKPPYGLSVHSELRWKST